MTTLKEIADTCNVSTSTVSLVLNKPHKISKEVRNKVYNTIIEVGYFKEKNSTIDHIGIVFNDFQKNFFGDFYSEVIFGILNQVAESNVNIRVLPSLNKVDFHYIQNVKGLIFIGKTSDANYQKAIDFHIPIVNCGHPNPNFPNIPTVYLSRVLNTQNLIQFVKNCGHKNIAIILGEQDENDIIRKEFLDTIKQNNPDFDKNLVFQANYDEIQTVEIIWNEIISRLPKITAVMCSNDLLAYYVYMCAAKYKTRIPEDISVTGFDGITFPRFTQAPSPKLTTVFGDRVALGKKSLELLYSILQGKPVKHQLIQMTGHLVIGDSVDRI